MALARFGIVGSASRRDRERRSRSVLARQSSVAAGSAAGWRFVAAAAARRGRQDVLHAARIPDGARGERAARPESDGHRLGSGRPVVGRRNDRLRARSRGTGAESRSDRTRRGARRHESRREDGQTDRVRRSPDPPARRESARTRRAGRRAGHRVLGCATRTAILRADTREVVTTGYGRLHGSVEGNANSLYWAIDNRIHTTGADLYLTEKDGVFEVRKTLSRGEWGATQDDAGRIYRNSSEWRFRSISCRRRTSHETLCCSGPAAATNRFGEKRRGEYGMAGAADSRHESGLSGRHRPTRRHARANTAACGPLVYRGDRLPADLYGNVFVAEPAAHLVSRIILSDDGTTITARKAYEKCGVHRVHRRALPARVHGERARRHAVRCRFLPGHPAEPRVHDGLPARLRDEETARSTSRYGAHLSGRARDDRP